MKLTAVDITPTVSELLARRIRVNDNRVYENILEAGQDGNKRTV